jgi:hypothetical protein
MKTLMALEDDNDVVQMVVRAPAAGDRQRARPIVLDEDNEEKIVDGVVEAVVEDNEKAMAPAAQCASKVAASRIDACKLDLKPFPNL